MVRRCLGCMAEYESEYGICPYCGYDPDANAESPLHMHLGTWLADRYLVGRVLGYGGFGVTYIAWDSLLNQRVAIKEYLPSEFATRMAGESQVSVFGGNKAEQFADGLIKFVDEARRLAKFQNEDGIVRVLDSFESNNTAYIVMEYLEGETLTAYLEREGTVPIEKAMSWLEPVVRSLEIVHQEGIIHRDIAPDNIFLTTDGRIKLIDFGAARYATTSHSRSLTIIIKPGYSPEEQYRSRGEQGPHTDVYALAAVLYRMITGVTPPDALERRAVLEKKKKDLLEPPSKKCKMDRSFENAILNAMNVQVEDRTETALAFWNELTSAEPVKRRGNKIKALEFAQWPLGLKIGVPAAGIIAITLLALLLTGKIGPGEISPPDHSLGNGMTRVPTVINYSIGAAQEMLDNQKLTPVISGRQQSEVIPADLVLTQSISGGQVVEENTQVELYISAAPEMQVEAGHAPDVLYFPEEDALAQFREQGIEPKVEYEYNDDVAAGLIVRQSVMGGDPLGEDDEVILIVSLGRDPAKSENENVADGTTALKMNRSALSLYIGDVVTLSASGGAGNYQWSSSNTSVLTVENGAVTAAGRGQAIITVTSGDETVTCPVTVREYSLSLSQPQLSLTKGNSVTLSVSGAPLGTEVSWSSSNTAVATVRNGQVTAVGAGNAVVTAKMTYGGRDYSATCSVTVTEEVASSIYLSQSALTLTQGDSNTITATVSPSGQAVTWSSSNTSVATVSNGQVTAKAAGTATITAQMTYGGQTYADTCVVTVTAQPGSLSISLETLELKVGETGGLITLVSPSGQAVTWSSSNTSVATVSNGQVTAKAAGTATITARMTYGGQTYSDTCVVTVTALPEGSLSVYPETLSLKVGETFGLGYSQSPTDQAVTWSSSNTAVATVNNNQVTAKSAGTTTITAKMIYSGKTYTDTCVVTVTVLPEGSLSITPKSLELEAGETYNLIYMVSPAEDIAVTWNSSNTSVATVSNGQVTAKAAGTAAITAQMAYGGKTYTDTCTVTVAGSSASLKPLPDLGGGIITGPNPSVELVPALPDEGAASISLNRASMTISMNDASVGEPRLTASITPGVESVFWSSSDTTVATVGSIFSSMDVRDGLIHSTSAGIFIVGAGTATITVSMTYNGQTYTDTCEVTVTVALDITLPGIIIDETEFEDAQWSVKP